MITRYTIQSEDGRPWATFLDLEKAQECLRIANDGDYHWPRNKKYEIITIESTEFEAQCWVY